MPEIDKSRDLVSQINHIEVAPADQEELARLMARNLDEVVALAPGFISSTIFTSLDGERVVNFVQWTSEELLDRVHDTDEFRRRLKDYRSLAIKGGPKLYAIAASRERDDLLPCEGPLTLHAAPDSCALACHVALIWCGAKHRVELVAGSTLHGETFPAIDPGGTVPALSTAGDRTLTESLAVLNFIADSHPDARLGAESPGERARLNESLAGLVCGVRPAWTSVFAPERFAAGDGGEEEVRAAAHVRLDAMYARLEGLLAQNDWLLFGRRTVADAYLYVLCRWKQDSPTSFDALPSLRRFKDRLDADPGVVRALSEEGLG